MRFNNFLYSTLALAASTFASSDVLDTTTLSASLTSTTQISVASGCSFSTAFTATAQSDLDTLAKCEAIDGDVVITGVLGTGSIANVKAIYGDLQIYNATSLESFAADSISTITGSLTLHGLTILSSLSFGSLESVGAIDWVTLPALVYTGLSVVSQCNSILISDTILNNLDGLNPINVETFDINNNFNLASISSNIQTVSNALSIAFNGDNTIVEFDDLLWANNLTFYSVASISMEQIDYVNKSAGFFKSSFDELSFPLITGIGGDLTIENNENLNFINFTNVETIGGGLVIVNNTDLLSIDNIDSIKTVQGAVVLKGDFDNCTMDALKTVRGSFDLETTGYADCTPFKKLSKNGGIQGDFTCKAKAKASSSSSASSSTGSKTKSTSTSGSTSTGSSSDSSSSVSSISSISKTSKGDASVLKSSSIFGTMAAILLSLL